MITYQLRFPAGEDLGTVLDRTCREVGRALQDAGIAWGTQGPGLEEFLKQVFDRHLVAYDTCDTSLICDETSTPTEWNPDPDPSLLTYQPKTRARVRRCHFRVPQKDIDAFGQETAEAILAAAGRGDLKADSRAGRALVEAWKKGLGPVLFLSYCRETEAHSGAREVDPWKAVRAGGRA